MKKLMSIILALCMTLSLCVTTAWADDIAAGTLDSVYIDTASGNDANAGSQSEPVKTLKQAMQMIKEGGTVYVTGNTTATFWGNQKSDATIASGNYYVTKSVTIEGYGTGMHDAHGIKLPTDFGSTLTLRNIDFEGKTVIGIYSDALAATAEIVIDNCRFAQAEGNCVFIGPEIKSLTVKNCTFTASSGASTNFLIWTQKGAETVTITNNKINDNGTCIAKGAIHLGNGGTSAMNATITGNEISGVSRGIQIAFTTGNNDTVNIDENTFTDVTEGAVILHEDMADRPTATITYGINNTLAGTTEKAIVAKEEDGKFVTVTDVVVAGTGGKLVENEDGTYTVIETCTVTFDANGGTAVAPVTVAYGDKVAAPADPTRDGYTFVCWLDGDGAAYDFDKAVTDDLTLTAQWEEVESSPAHTPIRRQNTAVTTTDTTTVDTTKTDTVTSAKTFDAGVAVYAVMGVLSLTGSAWVVGKKRV